METDIDKEHADHAQQQAADARHLHGTRQVEPLPQVGNLPAFTEDGFSMYCSFKVRTSWA